MRSWWAPGPTGWSPRWSRPGRVGGCRCWRPRLTRWRYPERGAHAARLHPRRLFRRSTPSASHRPHCGAWTWRVRGCGGSNRTPRSVTPCHRAGRRSWSDRWRTPPTGSAWTATRGAASGSDRPAGLGLSDSLLAPLDLPPVHPLAMACFGFTGIRSANSLTRRFDGDRGPALLAGLAAHSVLDLGSAVTGGFGCCSVHSATPSGGRWPKADPSRSPTRWVMLPRVRGR